MKRSELKQLILEAYVDYLRKQNEVLITEDEDKDSSMVFGGEGATLPDAKEQILAKFPTLKHALIRLHTDDYEDFVSNVEWVSPKPTVFRVTLTNGQNYTLKWMGKDFEMEIMGKTYYIGTLTDYQRALQKLTLLYQEGPMGQSEEGGEPSGEGGEFPGAGGGSGDFPGGEEDFGTPPEGEEDTGSEDEGGGEDEHEDLSNDNVDFEADADI